MTIRLPVLDRTRSDAIPENFTELARLLRGEIRLSRHDRMLYASDVSTAVDVLLTTGERCRLQLASKFIELRLVTADTPIVQLTNPSDLALHGRYTRPPKRCCMPLVESASLRLSLRTTALGGERAPCGY